MQFTKMSTLDPKEIDRTHACEDEYLENKKKAKYKHTIKDLLERSTLSGLRHIPLDDILATRTQ